MRCLSAILVSLMSVMVLAAPKPLPTATRPATRPAAWMLAQPTKAVLTAMQTSVTTGEAINVSAIQSTLNHGSPLTADYRWDFGDPAGQHNSLIGFNAGHVYDQAGIYTITLTLTDDNGAISTATTQATIAADTRVAYYVDGINGSDANSGISPDHPLKTVDKGFSLFGSNTEIFLCRNQVYPVTTTLWFNGHDQLLGAYGVGTAPSLMFAPVDGSQAILFVGTDCWNITIQDLAFDSPNAVTAGPADDLNSYAVWAGGSNLVVRRNTFLNVGDAINGTLQPQGVVVENNQAPLLKGVRGYLTWVDGSGWTITGNQMTNTTRAHCVRINDDDVVGVLVSGNDLTKQYPDDDEAEAQKTTVDTRIGHFVYVTNNLLHSSTFAISPSPGQTPDQQATWVVYANNYVDGAQLVIDEVGHHVMIRDNVFNISGTGQIAVTPSGPFGTIEDLMIFNNTGINTGTDGNFINVFGSAPAGSILLSSNAYLAPNLRIGYGWDSAVWINAVDTKGFSLIVHNIWPGTHRGSPSPNAVNYLSKVGFMTTQSWDSLFNVRNDKFTDLSLPKTGYLLHYDGVTAGARSVAATQPVSRPIPKP